MNLTILEVMAIVAHYVTAIEYGEIKRKLEDSQRRAVPLRMRRWQCTTSAAGGPLRGVTGRPVTWSYIDQMHYLTLSNRDKSAIHTLAVGEEHIDADGDTWRRLV